MSDIHDMPGHVIRRLNQISTSVFNDGVRAAGFDLTAVQFAALDVIAAEPGLDQARLAGAIAYDRATIGGVVDRLEAKGLVARRVSRTDRRARELRATEAGLDLLARIKPVVRDLQPRILGGLDEEERQLFLKLARKAAAAGNALSRAPLVRG
ncbi:MarR family transcriptional regulator [Aquicoccus sp. SCR17]|nr:MarR family transcriptional regulator [Carideicomes alvinocaridis]